MLEVVDIPPHAPRTSREVTVVSPAADAQAVPRRAFQVCVFCGSSAGHSPAFVDAGRTIGRALAARGMGLVYGGASIGVMGAVANACLEAGGHVEGVIPGGLFAREVAHSSLSHLFVVESMHARKSLMAARSDAFVALPGGYGTLEELFEVITWSQIGIHAKPIALLNVDGFFSPLLDFIDTVIAAGFIRPKQRGLLHVHTDVDGLLEDLTSSRAIPPVASSMGLEQS